MNRFTRRGRMAPLLAALALFGALIFAATATAGAPNPEATGSVIGGHNTTIAAYPSLAFIEGVQATAGYACTGTVVAPRVIPTAGHCVEDIESSSIVEPELIAVATGVSNLKKIKPDEVSQVEKVLAYIDKEDSPRALAWQLDLLREAGFARIDVLHKNGPFAAYGAVK